MSFTPSAAGKGDDYRPVNFRKYTKNFENIKSGPMIGEILTSKKGKTTYRYDNFPVAKKKIKLFTCSSEFEPEVETFLNSIEMIEDHQFSGVCEYRIMEDELINLKERFKNILLIEEDANGDINISQKRPCKKAKIVKK